MLNPVKLFLLTMGAVVVLSVAPYLASKAVPKRSSDAQFSNAAAATRMDSSDAMAELPAPNPGARVEALRTKMTETPARKTDKVEKKSGTKEDDLPRPRESSKETASAKTEAKGADKKAEPTATPKVELPFRADVQTAQQMLLKLGQFDGKTDGKLGPITQAAISAFQEKNGISGKGEPTAETLKKMESALAALAPKVEESSNEIAESKTGTETKEADTKNATAEKTDGASKADDPQFVVLRKSAKSEKPADIGPVPRMTRVAEVKQLQEKLAQVKIYSADVDGRWGHLTIVAMKEFQEKHKLKVTGKPNQETWEKLNELASAEWEVVEKEPAEDKPKRPTEIAKTAERVVITDAKPVSKKTKADTEPLTINVKTPAAAPAEKLESKNDKAAAAENGEAEVKSEGQTEAEPKKILARTASPAAPSTVNPPAELAVSQPAATDSQSASASSASAAVAAVSVATPEQSEPPSLSAGPRIEPGSDVVVKLNADAGISKTEALATPATVSAVTDESSALHDPSQPVLLPVEETEGTSQKNGDTPSNSPSTAASNQTVQKATSDEPAIVVRAPKREAHESAVVPPSSAPVTAAADASTDKPAHVPAAAPEKLVVSAPAPAGEPVTAANTLPSRALTNPPALVHPTEAIDESELPPAASKAAAAKLEKDLAEAQAKVAMVSNDPRYELDKYAPKALETVNSLVGKLKADVGSSAPDSASTRASLRKIEEELEKAKQLCLKQKAEQKVAQVDTIYQEVKDRFGTQITKAAKSNDESVGKLADLMAKIDAGYTAMKADFNKGNYDPIVERCDGFKLQIEILGNEAAREYLETELEKSKKKLPKETLAEIEELRGKNKFMEAATLLDSAAKLKSSSSGKRKS